jgi:hypothetical protein
MSSAIRFRALGLVAGVAGALLSGSACEGSGGAAGEPEPGLPPIVNAPAPVAPPLAMVPGGAGMMAAPGPIGGAMAMPPSSMMNGMNGVNGMNGAAGTSMTGPAAGSGGSAAPARVSYKAKITVAQVPSGGEDTICVQVRLDNPGPVNIVGIHNVLSPASHHFIVSKVTNASDDVKPNSPCTGFSGAVRGAPFAITQKHDDVIELPDGVSYTIGARQLMHLELHYLNVTAGPLDVVAETELVVAATDAKLEEATVLLIGTGDIALRPGTKTSTGAKFTAMPAALNGVRFFALTGHTHRFGTNVTVSSANASGAMLDKLYPTQPFVWDAPEMRRLEPAVTLPAGGGFTFTCDWDNPTDKVIGFGESALQEMCFFWAYYYPKKPVTNVLLDGVDLGTFLNP